ncbi:hypothetical protein Tco_0997553 [Tanacetum coccineum]
MCEVLNGKLVDGRDMPIIKALEYTREYLMRRIVTMIRIIANSDGLLTPTATRFLNVISEEAVKYTVSWNGDDMFQVNGPWRYHELEYGSKQLEPWFTRRVGLSQARDGTGKPKNIRGGVGRGRGNNTGGGTGRGNNVGAGRGRGRGNDAGGGAGRGNNAGVGRGNNAVAGKGKGNNAGSGVGRGKNE